MKRLSTPLIATLLALCASFRLPAAEPESSFGLAPSAAPQVQPSSAIPLIPDAIDPATKPAKAADQPMGGDKTSVAEDRLKKRIQLRQVLTKVEREPDLQAIKVRALAARTDFEQRKIFLDYYTAFCDRIPKFDKTIPKEDIDALRTSYTARFYQSRISPTIDPAIARAQHN
jgi:hypothetical protein